MSHCRHRPLSWVSYMMLRTGRSQVRPRKASFAGTLALLLAGSYCACNVQSQTMPEPRYSHSHSQTFYALTHTLTHALSRSLLPAISLTHPRFHPHPLFHTHSYSQSLVRTAGQAPAAAWCVSVTCFCMHMANILMLSTHLVDTNT